MSADKPGTLDPYHKWLGIPPHQRPITHYQILGISPTETDVGAIEDAAIRQTRVVRGHQLGPHAEDCQLLLNQIAEARLVLVNPAKRREYDKKLSLVPAGMPTIEHAIKPANAVFPSAIREGPPKSSPRNSLAAKPPPPRPASNVSLIIGVVLGGLALFGITVTCTILLLRFTSSRARVAEGKKPVVVVDEPAVIEPKDPAPIAPAPIAPVPKPPAAKAIDPAVIEPSPPPKKAIEVPVPAMPADDPVDLRKAYDELGWNNIAPFKGWGLAVDPANDCKFIPEETGVSIRVPGGWHDLNPENGRLDAPRIMQPSEGDFSVTVKVAGEFKPGNVSFNPQGVPYFGAGICIWFDDDNFVRFERAAMVRNSKVYSSVLFEERKNGKRGFSNITAMPVGECFLRVERKKNKILTFVSQDMKTWRANSPLFIDWPAPVKIGMAAVNSSDALFEPRFEGFTLKRTGTK